MRDGTTNN